MKSFRPKFSRVKARTKSDARLMAESAVGKLTTLEMMRMEKDLRITIASIKNLNPRMCFRIIAWVREEKEEE